MSESDLSRLKRFRLIDLTTFKRSGVPVTTPVRFAIDGDRIVVSLQTDSGKMKRLRTNPRVRIAGHGDDAVLDGRVRQLQGSGDRAAYRVLTRRYRLLTLQRLIFGRRPRRHTSAEIRLEHASRARE